MSKPNDKKHNEIKEESQNKTIEEWQDLLNSAAQLNKLAERLKSDVIKKGFLDANKRLMIILEVDRCIVRQYTMHLI
jgi:hypothetical protein